MKATRIHDAKKLTDVPNIGPAMVRDFALLEITIPSDLKSQDAFKLYQKLCRITGVRQDPCVLDTFIAVVDFASGAPARPWSWYTKGRKEKLLNIQF